MPRISRRECLAGIGLAGAVAASVKGDTPSQGAAKPAPIRLDITDYQPRSMLHVPATPVEIYCARCTTTTPHGC